MKLHKYYKKYMIENPLERQKDSLWNIRNKPRIPPRIFLELQTELETKYSNPFVISIGAMRLLAWKDNI